MSRDRVEMRLIPVPLCRRIWSAGVAVLLLSIVFAGCSPPALEGPYAEEFAQAIEGTDSEFVREILRDGMVEEDEFREAVTKIQECLDETGTGVTLDVDEENANYGWAYPDDQFKQERDEAVEERSAAWFGNFGEIGSLYFASLRNPNNEDEEDLFAACLVRHGLAPEGFTGSEYEELNYLPEFQMSCGVDEDSGEAVCTPPEVEPPNGVFLPDGSFLPADDQVLKCLIWPLW